MKYTSPHLQALEEIEQAGIPGLLEMLREEGIDGVRYALWNASGCHFNYGNYLLDAVSYNTYTRRNDCRTA